MRKSRTVGNDENGFNIDNVPITHCNTQNEVELDREPEQPSEAAIDQAPQKSEQPPIWSCDILHNEIRQGIEASREDEHLTFLFILGEAMQDARLTEQLTFLLILYEAMRRMLVDFSFFYVTYVIDFIVTWWS